MSETQKPYLGDLEKTGVLSQLFEIPREQRDDKWTVQFLANVAEASFRCGDPQVVNGPDGFPYFQLNMPEPYKGFQCFVVKQLVPDFLLQHGIGIVINAITGNPDWVFSYGDVVNYHLRNEFYTASKNSSPPELEVLQQNEDVLVAQPAETYLPSPARKAIRLFLESIGITDSKILLMARTKPEGIQHELVFNLTPDKFQSPEQFKSVMSCLSWYLPRHYSFVTMQEKGMDGFEKI